MPFVEPFSPTIIYAIVAWNDELSCKSKGVGQCYDRWVSAAHRGYASLGFVNMQNVLHLSHKGSTICYFIFKDVLYYLFFKIYMGRVFFEKCEKTANFTFFFCFFMIYIFSLLLNCMSNVIIGFRNEWNGKVVKKDVKITIFSHFEKKPFSLKFWKIRNAELF